MRLNKEYKPVKANLDKMLNAKYLESTVPIHKIKYHQVYRNNGMYQGFKRLFLLQKKMKTIQKKEMIKNYTL